MRRTGGEGRAAGWPGETLIRKLMLNWGMQASSKIVSDICGSWILLSVTTNSDASGRASNEKQQGEKLANQRLQHSSITDRWQVGGEKLLQRAT